MKLNGLVGVGMAVVIGGWTCAAQGAAVSEAGATMPAARVAVPVGTPIPANRIEIQVGNEIITTMEIEEPLRQLRERAVKEFRGDDLEKRLSLAREQHLKRLVEQKLLLLEAREQKTEISDAQVTERAKQEIESLRTQFPSEKEFEKQLAMEHLTVEDLQSQREKLVREQLLQQKLVQAKMQELSTGADVTESQLAEFYAKHKDEFKRATRVRISQIFVPRPDAGLPADAFEKADRLAQAKIREALADVHARGSFEASARKYSEHRVTAEKGGEVGWVEQGELGMPEFDKAVFDSLKAGEVSKVISTGRGYFIVKVEERQEGGVTPFEEVRGRIRQVLMNEGSESRYQAWMDSLKKKFNVVYADARSLK